MNKDANRRSIVMNLINTDIELKKQREKDRKDFLKAIEKEIRESFYVKGDIVLALDQNDKAYEIKLDDMIQHYFKLHNN
jgi:hypothetical protein